MKRCGYFKPFGITVIGRIITIRFVSDLQNNAKGFKLTWIGNEIDRKILFGFTFYNIMYETLEHVLDKIL